MVAATIRTIFAQPDPDAVITQLRIVADSFQQRYPAVSDLLIEAETDVAAYATFPQAHWKKIWSTNPLERLMREIKRRADVVGIFPDDASILRLVGAVLSEQHDEWQVSDRRYLGEESMALINATDHKSTPQGGEPTPRRRIATGNIAERFTYLHHTAGRDPRWDELHRTVRPQVGRIRCLSQDGWPARTRMLEAWLRPESPTHRMRPYRLQGRSTRL